MSAKSGVVQGAAIVIADPINPFNVLQPNADGSINIRQGIAGQYTPSGPSTANALVLQAGGAAQILFAAGEVKNGAVIENPLQNDATGQNIAAAESIWYDITGAVPVKASGGSSMELKPGQTVGLPGGLTTSVSWIAVTVGHAISGYKW